MGSEKGRRNRGCPSGPRQGACQYSTQPDAPCGARVLGTATDIREPHGSSWRFRTRQLPNAHASFRLFVRPLGGHAVRDFLQLLVVNSSQRGRVRKAGDHPPGRTYSCTAATSRQLITGAHLPRHQRALTQVAVSLLQTAAPPRHSRDWKLRMCQISRRSGTDTRNRVLDADRKACRRGFGRRRLGDSRAYAHVQELLCRGKNQGVLAECRRLSRQVKVKRSLGC